MDMDNVKVTNKRKSEKENRKWYSEPENLLRFISILHLTYSPFTKVEESFNLQATHDLLYHKLDLDKYDHLEFPGVVPRTFIGPLILALISAPLVTITNYYGTKFIAQIVVRLMLSEIVIQCFQKFRRSISKEFGSSVGIWLVLIAGSQFHFMYYMSRTLPNIMALPAALLAFHYWIKGSHGKFLFVATFDSIVFRSELTMLFGIILLMDLYHRRTSFGKVLFYGVLWSLLWIAVTVTIDSIFWGRTLWPEGEVFWYNTVLNQSHKWGTLPFFWYFYSAIPRGLFTSIFLLPFGLYRNSRLRILLLPAILFVFLYSFLPHKELRFIVYVFPLLNVGAAMGSDYLWKNRWKGFIAAILSVAVIFSLVVNCVLSVSFSVVSSKNYPGGTALLKLHYIQDLNTPVNLHIDVYCAQNGVSRFLEISPNWIYNKTEDLNDMSEFTHLLIWTESKDRFKYIKSHEVLGTVEGFHGIDFKLGRVPPVRIKSEPKVYIMKRKPLED